MDDTAKPQQVGIATESGDSGPEMSPHPPDARPDIDRHRFYFETAIEIVKLLEKRNVKRYEACQIRQYAEKIWNG